MIGRIKLIAWALSISFVGSLPLGTLNLGVVSYVSHHNLVGAMYFSIAAIAVEMGIVRVAPMALARIAKLKRFHILFSVLACLLLLAFGLTTLAAAKTMQPIKGEVPVGNLHPVVVGLLLSVANPLHLPFWMGWTAVLRSKSILDDNRSSYNTFVIAIGVGTAFAFMVYGVAGLYLTDLLGRYQEWLNRIIGAALVLTALTQLYKTFLTRKKAITAPVGP
ncbi:hypothetical protein KK062_14580 [Fulvivirgaceae bacterium PWU5]|uniref:Lysine transporter LysE n=1 Tax=Dawidia cretensis TaxID=2782350 RepID=A0AAP2GQA4_9BACT|nr:LysE family transporter [Dawidia cretensis]MBT1709466.1 hypothetical protein [Dawidia cretensis]